MPIPILAAVAAPCPVPPAYRERRRDDALQPPRTVRTSGGGTVTLFGADHLRDPAAPQFAEIATAFAAAAPTLALYEGPDRGIADDARATIRTRGESGYLRWIATHAGVAVRTLEPAPVEQAIALRDEFGGDDIVSFFALREAARLREREGADPATIDAAMATLLSRMKPLAAQAGLTTTIHDVATLSAAAARMWPGRDWRALPANWFTPGDGSAEAAFLPRINTALSMARDRHLLTLVTAAARRGERVFVVIGRDHVPAVLPALTCQLGQGDAP